jgi:predicted O-methyltransferase YrrM
VELDRNTQLNIQNFVRSLTNADEAEIQKYIYEIMEDNKFHDSIAAKANSGSGDKPFSFRMLAVDVSSRTALYVLCRTLKPDVVVETGVASGMSSAFILRALDKNAKGKLHSIDVPWHTVKQIWQRNPADEPIHEQPIETKSGWIIPERLKERWDLTLGKTSEKLPALLKKIAPVDIFFHDSAHVYENMIWEFQTIWPNLRKGGIMMAHNIDKHSAFADFEKSVGGTSYRLSGLNNDGREMFSGGKAKE